MQHKGKPYFLGKLIIDMFAGGGGTSTGLEIAFGRPVDIAINHNPAAVEMHKLNHPETEHYCEDIWDVDPVSATRGRPVGLLWLSPDCTHHSQAAGSQPRSKTIRGLPWVGKKWAGKVLPDTIALENVKQITMWGRLVAKRDKETGRVIKMDGTVAMPGERVKVQDQFLVPDKNRRGETWKKFIRSLVEMGYAIEYKTLVAADFGAGTSRERLFMVAQQPGKEIVWPTPTHAKNPNKSQKHWVSAASSIDWSIPCPSIFTRPKPLAKATQERIAKGIEKYVKNSANPFIVPIAHFNGSKPVHNITEPLRTITAQPKGGSFAVAAPILAKLRGSSIGTSLSEPVPTITSGGNSKRPAGSPHALGLINAMMVPAQESAFLVQANGGFNTTLGHDVREPMSTITSSGSQQQLVTACLAHLRGGCDARDMNDPMMTITAGGGHHGVITANLELTPNGLLKEHEEGALRVAAFLTRYYGQGGQLGDLHEPLHTITTKDRLALVTVTIKGSDYVIVDIGFRMLQPHELYKANSFPDNYIITHGANGVKFTKSEQVHFCGNSVPPVFAAAIGRANCPDLIMVPDLTVETWKKVA